MYPSTHLTFRNNKRVNWHKEENNKIPSEKKIWTFLFSVPIYKRDISWNNVVEKCHLYMFYWNWFVKNLWCSLKREEIGSKNTGFFFNLLVFLYSNFNQWLTELGIITKLRYSNWTESHFLAKKEILKKIVISKGKKSQKWPKNGQKIWFGISGSYRTKPKLQYSVNSVQSYTVPGTKLKPQ